MISIGRPHAREYLGSTNCSRSHKKKRTPSCIGKGWRFDPGIVGGMNMIKTCAELKAIKGLIKKNKQNDITR